MSVLVSNIQNSIKSAGFSGVANDWHIAKHDVYGTQFLEAWENMKFGCIFTRMFILVSVLKYYQYLTTDTNK